MRLKELQKKSNNTIKQTANDLNIAISTYNNYLIGTREPDIEMIKLLADYFCVSTDYLLEHDSITKLDLTALTNVQRNTIEIIQNLNSKNCERLFAYAEGLFAGQEEQQELIKKLHNSN